MLGHLDHLKTHVISAILNIKQKDMEEEWPLQIFDNDGVLHEVKILALLLALDKLGWGGVQGHVEGSG